MMLRERRNAAKRAKMTMWLPVKLLLWLSLLLTTTVSANTNDTDPLDDDETEPSTAVLFPWFSQVLGIFVFFLLTRYLRLLPYTAVMFVLGTFMGIGAVRISNDNRLHESIAQWVSINGELLLLVFLPGLLFRDAFGMNVRIFLLTFWQLLLLAYPMVLAGTVLTGLVGYYILPYNWSFNLSMTFGAILSATDPVAVAALLNEVGAPPRLKMHISGESLLNDGSAFVFFTIFSLLFLTELGVAGIGETIDVGEGFAIFFRMSLGGMAFGIAFGLGLVLILYKLNRRLNMEENVIQTAATITIAYLSYYTADICDTSGIIAVVFSGITAKAFGSSMVNDPEMLESFWILVEHLLNTLLFALAGTVWGSIIANATSNLGVFTGKDWGYLFLLYVLVNAIRFFLVGAFYPIFSRIGLGSNWQEAVFLSYAGLRGAVGIALALSLDSEVREATETYGISEKWATDTTQLFTMVGGIVLLTLVINGSTCGPLLVKLGLARRTIVRERLLQDLEGKIRENMLDEFLKLLSDPRYADVDFSVVKYHVHLLQTLTLDDLRTGIERNKDVIPNLENVLPYLLNGTDTTNVDLSWTRPPTHKKRQSTIMWDPPTIANDKVDNMNTEEVRLFFIGIVRCVYSTMIDHGELDGRDGAVTLVLLDALDVCTTKVEHGEALRDWEVTDRVSRMTAEQGIQLFFDKHRHHGDDRTRTVAYQIQRIHFYRALAFYHAHSVALDYFNTQFTDPSGEFAVAHKTVVKEIKSQMKMALDVFESTEKTDKETFESHALCTVLLNRSASYVGSLHMSGILLEREANEYMEEIEAALDFTRHCNEHGHPDRMSREEKDEANQKVNGIVVTKSLYVGETH